MSVIRLDTPNDAFGKENACVNPSGADNNQAGVVCCVFRKIYEREWLFR